MKKIIAIVLTIVGIGSHLNATTVEDMNNMINQEKNDITKQILMCERETHSHDSIKNGNPQVCLTAVKKIEDMTADNIPDLTNFTMLSKHMTFEEAKNSSLAEAYFNAGILFQYGKKYNNLQKALKYYKKSAELGNSNAQYNLGILYVMGKGIKHDRLKAYQWWNKAAKQGHEDAQHNLDILCKQSPWACKQ